MEDNIKSKYYILFFLVLYENTLNFIEFLKINIFCFQQQLNVFLKKLITVDQNLFIINQIKNLSLAKTKTRFLLKFLTLKYLHYSLFIKLYRYLQMLKYCFQNDNIICKQTICSIMNM